jgi:hypothetical protein
VSRFLQDFDATDVRDLVVIALFTGSLAVWAAIGAGA